MVRTRKQDYGQAAQQTRARASKADHIGKQNEGMVFSRFGQLPCELRLMVWEAALTPRLVAVIPRPCLKDRDEARNRNNREISLLRGIPALLAINPEGRHVALRHYTWRFTIDVTVSNEDPWFPDEEYQRARVVMSPDDTLGLFRCENSWTERVRISRFDVKIANDTRSPWRLHETTNAPEHGFKKVAFLGTAIESKLDIVRALNTTLWDLDSILHSESAEIRRARSPHTKHEILLESAKVAPRFWDLVEALPNRRQVLRSQNTQHINILAFQLAEGENGAGDWKDFLALLSRP